jgi:peptide/nickel transport system ATP-binding protein
LAEQEPILTIDQLTVDFPSGDGRFTAVNNISFDIFPREIFALVGESGSGKTVTALSVLGLLGAVPGAQTRGSIRYFEEGKAIELIHAEGHVISALRGKKIAMIFQDPMNALNPSMRCGDQVMEMLHTHGSYTDAVAREKTVQVLCEVGIAEVEIAMHKYPHQLSGGQRQRVLIAMALVCDPEVLIADEPTTALDAGVRRKVLQRIMESGSKRQLTILFITHDLDIVADFAHRVAVMYAGKIVEINTVQALFSHPEHPYTKGLINCRPPKKGRMYFLPTIDDFMRVSADGTSMEEITSVDELYRKLTISEGERAKRLKRVYAGEPILRVNKVSTSARTRLGWATSKARKMILNGVSLSIYPGETLGLVGESGCGKTTLSRCVLGLERPENGTVEVFDDRENAWLINPELRTMGKYVQYIFQDSYSSLDPEMSIGQTLTEPLLVHHPDWTDAERRARVLELMAQVGLKPYHYERLPAEFSGGQRQRIAIARALLLEPQVIICDEPVSSLDASVQAQVLNLLNELKYEYNLSYLFISHDMNVVRFMSDRILVMHEGKIVEEGESDHLFAQPKLDYTRSLMGA